MKEFKFDDMVVVNDEFEINYPMPKRLQEFVDIINQSLVDKDMGAYDYGVQAIDHVSKQAAIEGQITEYQCQMLLHKWGYK